MSRDPLTERYPRQARDVDPNPRAWFEGPHDRPDIDLAEPAREPWHRFDGWILAMLAAALIAFFVAAGFVLCRVFTC